MATYNHNPNQVPAAPDEWTPVLNGDVFCSPACGHECKKADYDRAVEAANALAARMGYRWEVEVWENVLIPTIKATEQGFRLLSTYTRYQRALELPADLSQPDTRIARKR